MYQSRQKLLRRLSCLTLTAIIICNSVSTDAKNNIFSSQIATSEADEKLNSDVPIPTTEVAQPEIKQVSNSHEKKAKKTKKTTKTKKSKKVKKLYAKTYVNVRTKPSKKSKVKFVLKAKKKVKVLKQTKKWTKISVKHSGKKRTGYVMNEFLTASKKVAKKAANKKAAKFKITGYCPCNGCSEGWGKSTKSGRKAKANHTVAADLNVLPMYTQVYIKGMGQYTVEDVGGGVKGNHIDVYYTTHAQTHNHNSTATVYEIEG